MAGRTRERERESSPAVADRGHHNHIKRQATKVPLACSWDKCSALWVSYLSYLCMLRPAALPPPYSQAPSTHRWEGGHRPLPCCVLSSAPRTRATACPPFLPASESQPPSRPLGPQAQRPACLHNSIRQARGSYRLAAPPSLPSLATDPAISPNLAQTPTDHHSPRPLSPPAFAICYMTPSCLPVSHNQ